MLLKTQSLIWSQQHSRLCFAVLSEECVLFIDFFQAATELVVWLTSLVALVHPSSASTQSVTVTLNFIGDASVA